MLRKVKAIIAVTLAICMMSTAAFASQTILSNNLVSKNAVVFDEEANSYKVKLNVPGVDGSDLHDEVILMVDGSYSGDNEWNSMKNTIITIGETVLNGSGNTQLTLMAFGMCDHVVLSHIKDVNTLKNAIGELPSSLLYGVSSTNCEAGITGVEEYINSHDETLNTAQVFYISDGEVNTDETPHDFYNWRENSWIIEGKKGITEAVVLEYGISEEMNAINSGANRSNAFATVFGADTSLDEIVANITDEQLNEYNDLVWKDVYEYSNLVPGNEYPVSEVEYAFVTYDKDHNTYLEWNFYYSMFARSYTYTVSRDRTIAAAERLLANSKVAALYTVHTGKSIIESRSAWMRDTQGASFVAAGSVAGVIDALEGTLTDLSKTPFSDVVVTDYMSKWVDLDQATISIVNNKTNEVIYTNVDGWLIPAEERPTQSENPVKIEIVSPENYADGGEATEGNTNGDIYKLTWAVKDGALLRADSYCLEYIVKADTQEEGFVAGTAYPANGITAVVYQDESGVVQTEDIVVPDIVVPKAEAENNESNAANELTFSKAKYAYIFGYAPLIVKNPDGTTTAAVNMAMEDDVTVEQVCAMISRAIDQEYDNNPAHYDATEKTALYSDKWYYRGISYLDSLGAFENGERIIGSATRGQVAQLIAIGLKIADSDIELDFTDIQGTKYEEYIRKVVARGYMQGMGNGKFEPEKIMSRAEFCALFNNILGKTGNMLIAKDNEGNTFEVTAETYSFVDMSPSHWAYDDCLIATSAYFEDGYVDMETRLENIRNKIDQYDAQKEY